MLNASDIVIKRNPFVIYMEFRKMVMITLYERQQKRYRYTEVFWTLWERERVG